MYGKLYNHTKNCQILFFASKSLSCKGSLKFPDATLFLLIFQVKVLLEVNTQVRRVISNASFLETNITTLIAAI